MMSYFLVPLAVASVIGYGCYVSVHWLERRSPEIMKVLALLMLFYGAFLLLGALSFGLIYIAPL